MQRGWIMALSYSPDSAWGDVEEFYENVASPRRQDSWKIESDVWGKTLRKDWKLAAGDGIAFYHTKRARFPRGDRGKRQARISLIGDILKVSQEGQQVSHLATRIRASDFAVLRTNPILRENSTEHLFQSAGMIQGTVATYYLIPSDSWAEIEERVRGAPIVLLRPVEVSTVEEEFVGEEGALRLRTHFARERDPRLVRLKKQEVFETKGRLACEVCDFDFVRRYGSDGSGVCEVHHRTSLSERPEESVLTRLEDLAIVCANCHRMLHKPETQCSIAIEHWVSGL
jgi:hypothetical protein